ncbi:hypothetical protein [Amycolatopsis magusensis]|uniref:hypothetical protein n=1 Tax=Amycolatopsis magusensis TaxID=882444 RepID=UPI0037AA2ED9
MPGSEDSRAAPAYYDPAAQDATMDPGRQFIGCLLQAPLHIARRALAGMNSSDADDQMTSFVLQLVIELVADDVPPAPAAVCEHARSTGRAGSETRQTRLRTWVFDTFQAAVVPQMAWYFKTILLEKAWRRAVAEHATRLSQAARSSPVDVLAGLLDNPHLAMLYQRYRAAADTSGELDSRAASVAAA